ncbi:hypothetical protein TCDM_07308 [Trypanosoma cruzi Dm28c]|uniref:carnosine N-methyltransferase n=2 Tax=Trypanosoma cruzi TaxID=5693 RepID=V5BEW2_TRYCR|nr:hypothetical protein TCDM_07308 [Trypanosoma cruzi Dm28c]PBJ70051.1 hypothetical protein BCY84_19074 [Trypanosoma cruzi cruzi]PWU95872.1 putative Carnosine N-methyltransferase [Trypanosoma cruzi]
MTSPPDGHPLAPPPYPLGAELDPNFIPQLDGNLHWPPLSPCENDDMHEDHISFLRTVNAFRSYRKQAMGVRDMRLNNFMKFHQQHKQTLCIDLERMFSKYLECIETNSCFFESICNVSSELFDTYWPKGTTVRPEDVPEPTPLDIDKVFTTLRQFVRDWSAEGAPERNSVYMPILTTLENSYPDRAARAEVKILVPGAGLCRLSVELALRGFAAQANEFSYHMLIAGHYIQNHVVSSCQHTIYPYVDNTSNLVNREDQFVDVHIPDLCAFEAIDGLNGEEQHFFGELSMVAGDFTEVYTKEHQRKSWNAVATCFFIDTAHNIVEYIEIIYNLLVPGGYWVNVGPLLYHFADSSDDVSIELSLGEVLTVAQRIGFVLFRQPEFIDTTYTNNNRSMKQLVYRCAFFLLQRPLTEEQEREQQDGKLTVEKI